MARSSENHPRITRTGWGDRVLSAQKALLDVHCRAIDLQNRPVILNENRTINLVVARSTASQPTNTSILVLLHGWGSGLGFFSRTLPHLIETFRAVYLVDLPGMGASSRPPFKVTTVDDSLDYFIRDLDQMAEILEKTDDLYRTAQNRILAAHSLGAYITVEWMLRRKRYQKLILISPVGVPAREEPVAGFLSLGARMLFSTANAIWRSGVTPQAMMKLLPSATRRRFVTSYISNRYMGDYTEEESERMIEYCESVSMAPTAGERAATRLLTAGAWAVRPLIGRLPDIDIPTTFVYGEQDWMDWRGGEKGRLVMNVPTRMERVPDADHNVFVDNAVGFAEAVVRAVRDFENGNFGDVSLP